MEECRLSNERALGVNSSFDVAAPTRKLEGSTAYWCDHVYNKLKGFIRARSESLKDLIDEMSLCPERRL